MKKKETSKENEKEKSFNSRINAPIARGINSRKENLNASSFFTPEIKAIDIVIPLLDIPGNKAKTCIIPINKTFFIFKLVFDLENFVRKRTAELKIKAIPKNNKEEKAFSIIL